MNEDESNETISFKDAQTNTKGIITVYESFLKESGKGVIGNTCQDSQIALGESSVPNGELMSFKSPERLEEPQD